MQADSSHCPSTMPYLTCALLLLAGYLLPDTPLPLAYVLSTYPLSQVLSSPQSLNLFPPISIAKRKKGESRPGR
jgi:hypothetical protein